MASGRFENVRLAGVASAVPGNAVAVHENSVFAAEEVAKVSASTGVAHRHLAAQDICTSDLCYAAAESLLEETGWPRDSIDILILVTQTPDYILPATACTLHGRLQLGSACAAFDVNLGCSGYVYGLWLAASLIQGGAKRVLLLAGDTISKIVSPEDRSVALLFGDAGTATAIEHSPGAPAMSFELGTDGTGDRHLMVTAGGFRQPAGERHLFMDGGEIFAFTMNRVPALCRAVLEHAQWSMESVDSFVLHQANRFMLQHLTKQMRILKEKVPLALESYGNTSSASIPLAMTESIGDRLRSGPARLILAGFGVGFSWAAAAIECGPLNIPPIRRLQ